MVKMPFSKQTNIMNFDFHVWHVFAVRVQHREAIQKYLSEKGIQTMIHYPVPPHKQPAYAAWSNDNYPISEKIHQEIISLPISPVMKDDEVEYVCKVVNSYTL
jgi:dTDP-4-amino-4,6-dideoxygalactose transaminase